MPAYLEVLFSPAEFAALRQRDLAQTVCVVFDVLRATSSMTMALANGAREIIPVAEISEALEIRAQYPDVLLAGERHGLLIRADQTGGIDFDLGNSPREYMAEKVRGRTIVITTTNGTRALRACAGARQVLLGSFLGLRAVADWIRREKPGNLILVCSGTYEEASYEDTLGAGALCDLIWDLYHGGHVVDSAQIARNIYKNADSDLLAAMQFARNGRRLLGIPDLQEDVPFSLQRDLVRFVAGADREGKVRKLD